MKKSSLLVLSSLAIIACTLAGCGSKGNNVSTEDSNSASSGGQTVNPNAYEAKDDEEVYDTVLGDYEKLFEEADALEDIDERMVAFSKAEAELLNSSVIIPTTTDGGGYAISRVIPRTVGHASYGSSSDKFKYIQVAEEFVTTADRDLIKQRWDEDLVRIANGEEPLGNADLIEKYTLKKTYKTSFTLGPETFDILNTSKATDAEISCNFTDGLVEHDRYGRFQPALASDWIESDDGLTWTFTIRDNVQWVDSNGIPYANVTAEDFVFGVKHTLDCIDAPSYILDGVIKGVDTYLEAGKYGDMADVGVRAEGNKLIIELEQRTPYFLSILTGNVLLPLNQKFFENKGDAYGVSGDITSILYNGAFYLKEYAEKSKMTFSKNLKYWDVDNVELDEISFTFSDSADEKAAFENVISGHYDGMGLSDSTLKLAQESEIVKDCIYEGLPGTTTYYTALNVNRKSFETTYGAYTIKSQKTNKMKKSTANALLNENFRKAIAYSFDQAAYNAHSNGEALKESNLVNTYTSPEFSSISRAIGDYQANTTFGQMVASEYAKISDDGLSFETGTNGWYRPELAKEYLDKALEELGDTVSLPIYLDTLTLNGNYASAAAAFGTFKQSIETILGEENVVIYELGTENLGVYNMAGYLAPTSAECNYDIFYGSGWGPDYGDPRTFLETFSRYGYTNRAIGLF